MSIEPYTMSVRNAAQYFGIAAGTLYNKISSNDLQYGHHYLKVGSKVLIVVPQFKKWLYEQAGLIYGENQNE